jgi:hypothetical protein
MMWTPPGSSFKASSMNAFGNGEWYCFTGNIPLWPCWETSLPVLMLLNHASARTPCDDHFLQGLFLKLIAMHRWQLPLLLIKVFVFHAILTLLDFYVAHYSCDWASSDFEFNSCNIIKLVIHSNCSLLFSLIFLLNDSGFWNRKKILRRPPKAVVCGLHAHMLSSAQIQDEHLTCVC